MTRFTKKRGVFSIKTLLILAIISILPRMEAKAAFNEIIQGQILMSDLNKPKSQWHYYVIRNVSNPQLYWGVDLRPSSNPFEVGVYAFVQVGNNANEVKIYSKARDQWVTYIPQNVDKLGNGGQKKQIAFLDTDPDHDHNHAQKFHLYRDQTQVPFNCAMELGYIKSNGTNSEWLMNYNGTYNPENDPQDRAIGAYNVRNDFGSIWVAETVENRIFCSIKEMTEETRPEFVYTMRTVTNSEGGGKKVSPSLTWPGDNGQEAHFAFYTVGGRQKDQYDNLNQVGENGALFNTAALYIYDCTKQQWVTHDLQNISYNNSYWPGVGVTRVKLTANKGDRRKFLTIYEKVSANTPSGDVAYAYEFIPFNSKNSPDFHNNDTGRPTDPVVNLSDRSHLSVDGYNGNTTLCFNNEFPQTAKGAVKNAWYITEVGPDSKSIRDNIEKDGPAPGYQPDGNLAAYQKEYSFEDLADLNVTINRSFKRNRWNTICVPFNISGRKVLKVFGSDVRLREFYKVQVKDGKKVMFFKVVDEIQAGKPYLVLPPTDVTNPTFENVILRKGDAKKTTVDGISMVGVYGPTRLNEDGTHLFIGTNNEFKLPTPHPHNQTRGMRAYFEVPRGTNEATLRASIFDDITGIEDVDIAIEDDDTDAPVFDINGQRVGTGLNGLNRGVYIMGGKKYVVK